VNRTGTHRGGFGVPSLFARHDTAGFGLCLDLCDDDTVRLKARMPWDSDGFAELILSFPESSLAIRSCYSRVLALGCQLSLAVASFADWAKAFGLVAL